MATAPASSSRVLTVPNLISVARLALIPVFVWLLLGEERVVAAAAVLAVLGTTDWIDGWIARRFDQASELGRLLDPLADRLAFVVCVAAIWVSGAVPGWLCAVVVGREAVVGAVAAVVALRGSGGINVSWDGKAGTFLLMISFPLLLLGSSDAGVAGVARVVGWLVVIPGLFFSVKAVVGYVPQARQALRDGKKARQR